MCGYQDFIMDTADEGVLRGGTIFYDKVYTEVSIMVLVSVIIT